MSDDPLFVPVPRGGEPVDVGLRIEQLAGLDPGDRAAEVAAAAVAATVPQAWLFPPVPVDGAAVFLLARHDVIVDPGRGEDDPDPQPRLAVSAPIGHVRVDGDAATIEWRPWMAPDEITEDTVPAADRDVVAAALLARPGYEQHALSDELHAAARAAAVGASVDGARLARLWSTVVPDWVRAAYRELGADVPAGADGAPVAPDPAHVPAAVIDTLGDPDATRLCTPGMLVAAAGAAGLVVAAGSPLAGVAPEAADDPVDLPPGDLAALADPEFVVGIRGIAGQGRVDTAIAIATVEGHVHWTGLSVADGAVVVQPGVDAEAVARSVLDHLRAAQLPPAPMLVLPVDAARMRVAAAVAEAHGASGAAAFALTPGELQARIDSPAATGVGAALTALAAMPRPVLDEGFGDPDFLGVADGALALDPMVRTYARRLDDVTGHLAVTLTDLGGDEPITAGHAFFTTEGLLWAATPAGGWGPGGVTADQRIDLVTLDPVDVERLIGMLLGADPGERPLPEAT